MPDGVSDGERTAATTTTKARWGAKEVAALREGSGAAWLHRLVKKFLHSPDTGAVDTAAQFVVGLLEHSCEQMSSAPFAEVWNDFCAACECCLNSGGL